MHELSASLDEGKVIDAYFDELEKMLKEEDMTYCVVGKYKDIIERSVYSFQIPGRMMVGGDGVYAKDINVWLKVQLQL